MTQFDPFTATLEEAKAQPGAHDLRGPIVKWAGAQKLIHRRKFYECNPLDGMAVCAVSDLVAPEWLAKAYLRGFYAVSNCRAKSWDEAFGTPFRKGSQLGAMRRRRLRRVQVYTLILDYVSAFPDRPLEPLWEAFSARPTDELSTVGSDWAEQARRIGVSRSEAQDLYREAVSLMGLPANFRKLAGSKRRD